MTDQTTGSPAVLYGPASLALGVLALISLALGFAGPALTVLSGSLATTFGVLGLRWRVRCVQCAIGLTAGAIAVLSLTVLVILMFGQEA